MACHRERSLTGLNLAALPAIAILGILMLSGCGGDKGKTMSRADLSRGFGLAIRARTLVSAAHDKTGRWPASNEEANLLRPEKYATESVADLTVSDGGAITVRFKSGGALRLMPDARHTPAEKRWRCTTTNIDNPTATIPCRPKL